MPYEVTRDKPIRIPAFRADPFVLGDVIPEEAFNGDVCPNRNLKRALLSLRRIEAIAEQPVEGPGVVTIDDVEDDDTWPRWHGGPWFLTPDGKKHRGKQKALAHMGAG